MYTLGIETFLKVVQSQSLSKAAKELHVAQTTISRRLIVLEQELGMTLIERGKGIKKIRLTTGGEEFAKLAEQWSYIWQEIQLLQLQGPKMTLSIASVDSLNSFVLPEIYHSLNQQYPQIKLKIQTLHSNEIYDLIEMRQADVGFTLQEQLRPNIKVEKCYVCPMVLLQPKISNDYHQVNNTINPAELDSSNELFMPWGQQFQIWHDYWWDPLHPSGIVLDNSRLLINLLCNPNQWAIVPLWVANAAAQKGEFSISRLSDAPPEYTCYKITHKKITSLQKEALDILNYHFNLSLQQKKIQL